MGQVTAFPYAIVDMMARDQNITTFIETGTRDGMTAFWAATVFKDVHTVDIAPVNPLASFPNVTQYHADSRVALQKLSLRERPAVLWLDAHWTGEEHIPGQDKQCPLIGELDYVRGDDIVLIDDARMFLCAPPAPFDPDQWPTIANIIHALPRGMFVQIVDDVIFAVPPKLKFIMRAYACARARAM